MGERERGRRGGAALSRAEVEISPSVAGSAAEETPARAARPCRPPPVLRPVRSPARHVQLHPRPARLPGGAQAGHHCQRAGGARLPPGRPAAPAPPAAPLETRGGDAAGTEEAGGVAGPCARVPGGDMRQPELGEGGKREGGREEGGEGGRAAIVRGSCRLASFPSPSLPALPAQPPALSPICRAGWRRGVPARQHPLPPSRPSSFPIARFPLPLFVPSPLKLGFPPTPAL